MHDLILLLYRDRHGSRERSSRCSQPAAGRAGAEEGGGTPAPSSKQTLPTCIQHRLPPARLRAGQRTNGFVCGRACEAPSVSLSGAVWGLPMTIPEAHENTVTGTAHHFCRGRSPNKNVSHLTPHLHIPGPVSPGRKLVFRGI